MKHRILLTAAAVTMLAASTLSAQQPAKNTPHNTKPVVHVTKVPAGPKKVELKEMQPGLMSQATVTIADATKTALGSSKGSVTSERLEKRGDQVVYVFGIRDGRRVRHVMVDARTGSIVTPKAHRGVRHHEKVEPKKAEVKKAK